MDFLLTTISGIEDLVVDELTQRAHEDGVDVTGTERRPFKSTGQVICSLDTDRQTGLDTLKRLRTIHHVFEIQRRFELPETDVFDTVRAEVDACDFPEMESAGTFRVTTERMGDHAFSSMDIAREAGAALYSRYKVAVDLENYDVNIHVDVFENVCVVSRPLTAASLSRRFVRPYTPRVATQPALAYALLTLAELSDGAAVLDPFCGSGTILIEAADAFPGLELHGGDSFPKAVEGASKNAEAAGAGGRIHFDWGRAQNVAKRYPTARFDAIVTNPPFGIALGPHLNFHYLYRDFLAAAEQVIKPGGRLVVLVWKRGIFLAESRAFDAFELLHERRVQTGAIRQTIFVFVRN